MPFEKANDDGKVGDELERERRDEPPEAEPLPVAVKTEGVDVEKNGE